METYDIPTETHAFAMKLFNENGIKFLYDLSLIIELVLKKEIEEYEKEEQRTHPEPYVIIDESLPFITTKEDKERLDFERKYAEYGNIKLSRDRTQELKQEKFDKEISTRLNKLSYGELITLAYKKSERNFGSDMLSFIYFQVKKLAEQHKVHLDSNDKCVIYVDADNTGMAKTTDVIDQAILRNPRIGTLGILEYILDQSIKEIESENEARYLLTDNENEPFQGRFYNSQNESDNYNDRGTIKGVRRYCDLDDVDDGLREEY